MLQVKRQSSSSNLFGASVSPSSSFMASVPYLADFEYLKSYSSLNDVSTDFNILDFQKDKKISNIYFSNPEKLKSLLSNVQSIRSQSLGRNAFQDFSAVLNEEWTSQINEQYPKSSNRLHNQLLLIKIPQNLSHQQLNLISDIVKCSNIDGIIVHQNQNLSLKQNIVQKSQKQERCLKKSSDTITHNQVLYHLFNKLGRDKIIVSSQNFTISGEVALEKVKSGASLVLINEWRNPFAFNQIRRELADAMRQQGIKSLSEVRGRK